MHDEQLDLRTEALCLIELDNEVMTLQRLVCDARENVASFLESVDRLVRKIFDDVKEREQRIE